MCTLLGESEEEEKFLIPFHKSPVSFIHLFTCREDICDIDNFTIINSELLLKVEMSKKDDTDPNSKANGDVMSVMFLDVSRSARKPWRFNVRIYRLLCVYFGIPSSCS
jgi:hypothetical protein